MPRSLRNQVLVGIIFLVVVSALGFGFATFHQIDLTAKNGARRLVNLTADTRKEMLLRSLARHQDLAQALISRVRNVCESRPRGVTDCARTLLRGFVGTDLARAALLEYKNLPTLIAGERSLPLRGEKLNPQTLAEFRLDAAGRPYYVIQAHVDGDRVVTVYYDMSTLNEIFETPPELGPHGETFLLDSEGQYMTPTHFPETGRYINNPANAACLAGESGIMTSRDYRGERALQAYRYIPEIGGGCVKALVLQSEVLAPEHRLLTRVLEISIVLGIFASILAFFLAGRILRPLGVLSKRVQQFEYGDLDSPVPVEGPSEIQAFARAFASMAEELRKMIKDREELVSIVSHDLKNPISGIHLAADLVKRLVATSNDLSDLKLRVASLVENIGSSCQHMRALVDDLLDLARIDAGVLLLERKLECADSLLTEATRLFQPLAQRQGITLVVDKPPESASLEGDHERLFQVLSNLIGNALKFTPKGGTICLGYEVRALEIVFFVRDSGPGVAPEALPYLFERFWQAKNSRRNGTGLGLYISKRIVQAHGGKIWAENVSASGSQVTGAVFRFSIPKSDASTIRLLPGASGLAS